MSNVAPVPAAKSSVTFTPCSPPRVRITILPEPEGPGALHLNLPALLQAREVSLNARLRPSPLRPIFENPTVNPGAVLEVFELPSQVQALIAADCGGRRVSRWSRSRWSSTTCPRPPAASAPGRLFRFASAGSPCPESSFPRQRRHCGGSPGLRVRTDLVCAQRQFEPPGGFSLPGRSLLALGLLFL